MNLLKNPKYHLYAALAFMVYVLCSLTLSKVSYQIKYPEKMGDSSIIPYYICEGVICGLVAYVLSNILLYFLERLIVFNELKRSAVIKMVVVFIVVVFAYSMAIWPLLDFTYRVLTDKSIDATLFMMIMNVPYFSAIFTIWLFIVVAIKAYRHINQVKMNQLQLESNLRESQLNTLKGQINPHFMFNSLNNIRGLILEDVPRARDMITRLSEMLRYSLTKNGINTIPLKEELQTVDNYIEVSKIQFEERLRFSINVNPGTLAIGIPPMVVQMLVENAVKHGIGKIKEGGEVRLHIDKTDEELAIRVENSGNLLLSEDSTRLGLENIKQRLSLLYGNKASFTLTENSNFVEAKILIPLT
ncbi:histidine kinase [Flavobacterium sp. DG1-102-2]|uniref:sensor histidine kinase n=1 Tax=Flavobacterium sp. DG1-102-2 TaxID=3081663 RepID=UPI002948F826|nr:histidine kinase [Flavobacterium sp. DG1-102-2]MDV6169890.1 histidine kinase [Flavobacterium sp. DG1-102-2]